jgi:hypothetical protein
MLQTRDVALHPGLNLLSAMLSIQHDLVGEMFEVNLVAIPAAVEAEEQNDGAMHHGSKQHRTGWQGCGRAEEIQAWTNRYVARLEHYARLAPYNWFNFYSFWD